MLVLALADAVALSVAGVLAVAAWAVPVRHQPLALYADLWPLIGVFLFGYQRVGLYPGFGLGAVELLRRQILVTGTGFLLVAGFSFALKLPATYSRVTFAFAVLLSLLFVPLARAAALAIFRRCSWWPEPAVVLAIGHHRMTAESGAQTGEPSLGFRPVGAMATEESGQVATRFGPLPYLGSLERAPEIAATGVQIALVEASELPRQELLDWLQQHFRRVVLLRAFGELPVEGVRVRNYGGMLGIELESNLLRPGSRALKRLLDLVVVGLAAPVALPLAALSALAVLLVDGRPVLYFQERVGMGGRRIRVPKIRTMRRDAEERLERHLATDPEARREWEQHFKLRHDPRLIPGIGALLRRLSLDELPQLWSVLEGKMSLVGPRPFPDYHLQRFPAEFQKLRCRVRPGVSGLWQVMVRSGGGLEAQQAFDSYYIRNWSLWLDLWLLARTVGAVVRGRGAY